MSGKRGRTKGHSFEREIANDLQTIFPNAKRQLEYQIDTCKGIDIANTEGFAIQCKNRKTYSPVNTIEEIKNAPHEVPVLVTKALRKPAMAVLPWKDLLKLLEILSDSN